ncbi:MAG: exodeoxyribonuclease-5 [Glaciecola sp.]
MNTQLQDIFPFAPTSDQKNAIDSLLTFTDSSFSKELYLLKGYAGTGKTTLISSYIQFLQSRETNFILMAPTGRAAKVLSNYSGEIALTIHKSIYYQQSVDGKVVFSLQKNKLTNCVFIVDEASMIGNSGTIGSSFNSQQKTLLDDLIEFVYTGKNCKLILIGDVAQLPPVGTDESPALNIDYLKTRYSLHVNLDELQEVTRQSLDSGILHNATGLRRKISDNSVTYPFFDLQEYPDIKKLIGEDIEDKLSSHYSSDGVESSIVICRSNKQANGFNKYIRYNVLYLEDELAAGDLLMVVKNNYFWMDQGVDAGFIANGDVIEVLRIINYEDRYGFRFANVSVKFSGLVNKNSVTGEVEMEVKLLLDTLYTETPALNREQSNDLYQEVSESYSNIKDRRKKLQAVKKDEYFNAVQVKFSYAITCHKAQGGQWKNAFVDQGYLTDEMVNKEYLRWLYTAITRAQENLYLLNFHDKFFGEK